MRKEWQLKPLGLVAEFRGGGTPPTDNPRYWEGDIPWVSPKDMKFDLVSSSIDRITPEAIANSATSIIPAGSTLVVVRSGILARTIPTAMTACDLTINQDIKALCPNKSVDGRYLHYFMRSAERELLRLVTRGATVHRLSTDSLKALPIPVPPIHEQNRLTAVLDEVFEKINSITVNLEKSLAGVNNLLDSYLKSIFGRKDGEWNYKSLQQVSKDFGRGKSKHRPRNDVRLYGGPYPFIQTGDVRNCDHVILESTQSYNETGLAQSKLWPKGTICITIAANVAETGILGFDACFPDSVIGIVVDETKTTNEFVEYLLQSVRAQLKAQGKGSAQDNINLGTFENRLFPFPSLDKQRSLVKALNEVAVNVRSLKLGYERKLAALAELKLSILQRAFAGKLREQPEQFLRDTAA